ncbi:efflux RND transporter periplasmic adaptor subunit [Mucilaginibacter defluvii]|uniref:Efflux RND transporter periplasmic adaptor subunit n=1 Tax=Mucilaginibacter defluvii TaxID=1196019 RepID=A0ABP9FWP3_9SPHI
MKKLLITGFFLAAVFTACQQQQGDRQEIASGHAPEHAAVKQQYTCPMHPQVIKDHPGDCPICGMTLVPVAHNETKAHSLKFSPAQLELANITMMTVGKGYSGQSQLINGRLAANTTQNEVISARAAGRIEKLFVKQTGIRINQGQPLYELYSEELLTLENEFLLAWDQYKAMGNENERFGSFLESAGKKLALYGLKPAQIRQLKKTHQVHARITMYATAGGIVTAIKATEGQYVAEGTALYSLEGLDQLWVEGELYPEEAGKVKMGQQIKVLLPGSEDQPLTAKVSFINPELQAGTQLSVIRATIQNPGLKLQPGMQVQIAMPSTGQQALVVPLNALVRDAKGSMVFVQTAKNTFEPRMVKTGIENERTIEIVNGLSAGETIAATGAYLIYSELVLKQGGNAMAGMQK